MAAVRVTALASGDGRAVAELWRELWTLHERWNGYPASHDPAVYASLAERLEVWALRRRSDPILGQHVHLVARDGGGVPVGQVEGWLERHGTHPATPVTCEVRSLVVAERARGLGVGGVLLAELERLARDVARGSAFSVAEVLEPNAAIGFYRRLGYRPIACSMMLTLVPGAALPAPAQPEPGPLRARLAHASDAMAVARLEMARRATARARGDLRLDPSGAVDASFAHVVASHLRRATGELVVWDGPQLLAQGSLLVSTLEAPFAPVTRAALGRLAVHEGGERAVAQLLVLAGQRARHRGARRLEVADLPISAGHPITTALQREGAQPFSQIVAKPLR